MNISQLQYLISAASLGSFTKAASLHHLTVPTISQSIKQLEEEMNTTIFHRNKKGVVLTKEGELILQHAASILKDIEVMQNELLNLKEEYVEHITISTIPGLVPQVVHVMLELIRKYPLLKVQMIEGDTQSIMKQVNDGHANLGLISFSQSQQNAAFEWLPISEGNAVLIMNKNSPLRFYQSIAPEDLENEVFVLYKDKYIEHIARDLMSVNETNRIALITNNIEALCQMVVKGNAITIAPDFIINTLSSIYRQHLVTVPLKQFHLDKAILGRITRTDEPVSKMVDEFTRQLTDRIRNADEQIE